MNRPFDDVLTPLILLEIEAKKHIQRQILEGNIELAWSFILDHENGDNPYEERRSAIAPWKQRSVIFIDMSKEIVDRALDITKMGHPGQGCVACLLRHSGSMLLFSDNGQGYSQEMRGGYCPVESGGLYSGSGGLRMKTDTLIRREGMEALMAKLDLVDAERFITLIKREPFDYTRWQETLYEGMSVEEICEAAAARRARTLP